MRDAGARGWHSYENVIGSDMESTTEKVCFSFGGMALVKTIGCTHMFLCANLYLGKEKGRAA